MGSGQNLYIQQHDMSPGLGGASLITSLLRSPQHVGVEVVGVVGLVQQIDHSLDSSQVISAPNRMPYSGVEERLQSCIIGIFTGGFVTSG